MIPDLPPAVILLAAAVIVPLLPGRLRSIGVVLGGLAAFGYVLLLEDGTTRTYPFLDYELTVLRADRLSLVFGAVFSIVTVIGGLFAFEMDDRLQQVAALVYAAAALGVTFAGDLFTLYVFWEMMAVASVLLIFARRTPQAMRAGGRYLIVHLFGGLLLLAGILLHHHETGSLTFAAFAPEEANLATWLILLGFALNAAVPPLHAWMTDAYPEATVTGSVFLSALTSKSAVYVLIRAFAGWDVLVWGGVVMALYGVVYALLDNDIRRILAYSIISQIGYMVAAVGIGTPMALNGATAHAFCHILYKALLFMAAGVVLHTTGTSKLTELGGLARKLRLTLALYMVGAVSIAGLPLFNGFISKSMVISAAGEAHYPWAVLLLTLASVGTLLHTGLRLPWFTWFGPQRRVHEPAPVPGSMMVGMTVAAALCVYLGVNPMALYRHLPHPDFADYHPFTYAHVVESLQLLALGAVGFFLCRRLLEPRPGILLDTDWFYRRARRPAWQLVTAVAGLFGLAQQGVDWIVGVVTAWARNPVARWTGWIRGEDVRGQPYDPDRQRLPVALALAMPLLCVIVLALWSLLMTSNS